jgi:hypothetical protein
MHPVDVHVLTCENTVPALLDKCLASLEGQACNVFVVDNSGCAVGPGRAKGYALGSAEFVSYIDCDDYATPAAFAKLAEAMAEHHAVVALEQAQWENGYKVPRPVRNHAPICYRREDVAKFHEAMRTSPWCSDALLRRAMRPVQLMFVGQVRLHRQGTASSNVRNNIQLEELKRWSSLMG